MSTLQPGRTYRRLGAGVVLLRDCPLDGPGRVAACGGAQATTWAAGGRRGHGRRGAASVGRWSGAVSADDLAARLAGEAAAMVHEKAAGAGELVGLLGQDAHGQFVLGQVRQVGVG
jgi:hypothetical protein